ncbi:MAG: hypothetical protein AAGK14_06725 [Verrucomicrobiota bacterium]
MKPNRRKAERPLRHAKARAALSAAAVFYPQIPQIPQIFKISILRKKRIAGRVTRNHGQLLPPLGDYRAAEIAGQVKHRTLGKPIGENLRNRWFEKFLDQANWPTSSTSRVAMVSAVK